jgi:hypothetical protein
MGMGDQDAIKQVIERAYITGIHATQDIATVQSGFHQQFTMLVRIDDTIEQVVIDDWLERVDRMKRENPELWSADTRHEFRLIDTAGYAAVAKLDVYKGEVHFSTDYMFLYKINDEWKIVSKIFVVPD